MTRKQRKARQQQEQIGENDPFMRQMRGKPGKTRPMRKARNKFAECDGGETAQRDRERMPVEQRHAQQDRRKDHELDGEAEQITASRGRQIGQRCDLPIGGFTVGASP